MTQHEEMQHEEKRHEKRHRTLKRGMVVFKDRSLSSEVTIRNESPHGALLYVDEHQFIPNYIELREYPSPNYRPAKIIWRSEIALGIKFLDDEEEKMGVRLDSDRIAAFEALAADDEIQELVETREWDGGERRDLFRERRHTDRRLTERRDGTDFE
ncbi:MAG: hypothetical protein AAGE89_17430 [Pseudomonadota bacterium]